MRAQVAKRLIIPVETANRELDSKLLLACCAAERGFSVLLGEKREIHRRMATLPRSIYIGKSVTEKNLDRYRRMKQLGHPIVSTDEEALVYYTVENYLATKVGTETLQLPELLFAWGPENRKIWLEHPARRGARAETIVVTGNPRVDLLRPELRGYWFDEAQQIRERFGKLVLVNTNFGLLNHFRPGWSRERNLLDATAASENQSVDAFDIGLAEHRLTLFEHFQAMLGVLSRAHPEASIVVRPHPSEDHEIWLRAAQGCSNVQVLHEGNSAPWLLAADAMIHNGCTTALERYLLGVSPAIAYQPIVSECFDKSLPNGLSFRASDLGSVLKLTTAALEGAVEEDAPENAASRRELIGRYVESIEGPLASERIVDALESFGDELAEASRPSRFRRLATGTPKVLRRGNARWRIRKAQRDEVRNAYYARLFPDVGVSELEARVDRLTALLDRFSGVRVRERHRRIFEITAHPGSR